MKNKKNLSKRLGAYSVAAGAAALGATSAADAALNVFDHRAAPLSPIVEYWRNRDIGDIADQTLAVMNVKTGDFQYWVETGDLFNGIPEGDRYNQDGFLDNNEIPESAKTDDTVWFSHRDMDKRGGWGPKVADGVTFETPTGGAGGQYDDTEGSVHVPQRIEPDTEAHDWYWAEQTFDPDGNGPAAEGTFALPLPVDGEATHQVDGALDYNDSSPTGYTGVVSHGFGGFNWYGSGSHYGVRTWDDPNDPNDDTRAHTVGFKLEEADGTHYGWVAYRHTDDRNRIEQIYGWGYQTTPGLAAELTWDPDDDVPGDYDGDTFVTADDVDILCANIGTIDPGLLDVMDLDDDGDVDADDQLIHITTLLEYDLNGDDIADGQGTFRADFNTDGTVDLADLTTLRTNSGLTGQGFADGDTNCDGSVDLADLTTLRGLSGSSVSGVPEPLTIGLLSLGGVGLLANRRRRS